MQVLLRTGLRIGEVAALDLTDVRLTQRTGELNRPPRPGCERRAACWRRFGATARAIHHVVVSREALDRPAADCFHRCAVREWQAQRAQLAPQNGVTGVRRGTPAGLRLPVSNRGARGSSRGCRRSRAGSRRTSSRRRCVSCSSVTSSPTRARSSSSCSRRRPGRSGRFNIVFRDPGTGELVFPELKGDNLMALTRNQKIYVPLFKEPGGARVRILGTDATHVAGLVLPTGHEEMVHGDNFTIVGSENLAEFTQTSEARATGKRGTNFLFADGKMRVFHSQEEFDAHISGMDIAPRTAPPPAKGEKVVKPPKPVDAPNPLYDPPGKKPPPGSSADPTAGPPGPFQGPQLQAHAARQPAAGTDGGGRRRRGHAGPGDGVRGQQREAVPRRRNGGGGRHLMSPITSGPTRRAAAASTSPSPSRTP